MKNMYGNIMKHMEQVWIYNDMCVQYSHKYREIYIYIYIYVYIERENMYGQTRICMAIQRHIRNKFRNMTKHKEGVWKSKEIQGVCMDNK